MAEFSFTRQFPQQFISIKRFSENIYKEKGSEFIAEAYPLFPDADSSEILTAVRKKYYDASHHCSASNRLNGEVKTSDDGEPAGSAGIRILGAIEHFGLKETLVIVTRYFGGTKLGVGPLGKAYHTSALEVLELAEKVTWNHYTLLRLNFPHELISLVYRLTAKVLCKQEEEIYSEAVMQKIWVSTEQAVDFMKNAENESAARIQVTLPGSERYFIL